jgi:hypothetical protein
MAFLPIPNVARLTLRFTGPQGQTMSFGLYWRKTAVGPFTALEVDGLAGDADVEFAAAGGLKATWLSSKITYVAAHVRALDTASSPQAEHGENAGPGAHVGVLCPLEVSACWSIRSNLTGRSHRNRVYWPGVNTSEMEDTGTQGVFKAGFVSGLEASLQAYIAALESGGEFVHVIASPKLGTYDPVSSSHVDVRPASQRRREA